MIVKYEDMCRNTMSRMNGAITYEIWRGCE